MSPVRIFFEALPIVLAVLAIFVCMTQALNTRRSHDRLVYLLMVLCAALMVAAQSSWTYTMLKGDLLGTDASNILWSVFNSLTMATFVLAARRVK
jgi:hypothetical protein